MKRKVAVRMSINDTMKFLKLAMVKNIDGANSTSTPRLGRSVGVEGGIVRFETVDNSRPKAWQFETLKSTWKGVVVRRCAQAPAD
jgi:hypothetical protein